MPSASEQLALAMSVDANLHIPNPFLEIRINAPHEQLIAPFHNAKEAEDWARNEMTLWDQARSRAAKILEQNGFQNIEWRGPVFPLLDVFAKTAAGDAQRGSSEPSGELSKARDELVDALRQGDLLTSESQIGRRILALEQTNPVGFAVALAANAGQFLKLGVTNARGQTFSLPFKSALDGYRARFPSRLDEIDVQSSALGDRATQLDQALQHARKGLDEVTNLQQTLRQKIATEQAVEIWRERLKQHEERRKGLLRGVIAAFVIVALLILLELWLMRPGHFLSDLASAFGSDAWIRFALLGLPVLAGIWVVRMLSVLYRVDVAGAQDAGERVAMVETLYALHAERRTAPTDAERMLVMHALFRPGPSGDHDPSLPNTLLEHIAKMAVRDRSA
jgi:hypothetical protein